MNGYNWNDWESQALLDLQNLGFSDAKIAAAYPLRNADGVLKQLQKLKPKIIGSADRGICVIPPFSKNQPGLLAIKKLGKNLDSWRGHRSVEAAAMMAQQSKEADMSQVNRIQSGTMDIPFDFLTENDFVTENDESEIINYLLHQAKRDGRVTRLGPVNSEDLIPKVLASTNPQCNHVDGDSNTIQIICNISPGVESTYIWEPNDLKANLSAEEIINVYDNDDCVSDYFGFQKHKLTYSGERDLSATFREKFIERSREEGMRWLCSLGILSVPLSQFTKYSTTLQDIGTVSVMPGGGRHAGPPSKGDVLVDSHA